MRAVQLFIKLTVYYLVLTAVVALIVHLFPPIRNFLPIGGAQALLTGASDDPFKVIEIGASGVSNLWESVLWMGISVLSAFATVLPLAWTYIACRKHDEYEQSLIETMVLLPIIVTGIVLIVHNSLALAFSLAGIVAGVRFRNTLKSSGDALYVFAAIAIGLSAGVGAMEIAIVMTMAVNYAIVILWFTEFGALKGTHRYMRRPYDPHADKNSDDAPLIKEKVDGQ